MEGTVSVTLKEHDADFEVFLVRVLSVAGFSATLFWVGVGVIDKETISSTFAGFAPYDNPKMSIVVVTPDVGHIYGNSYFSGINRRISQQISKKYFEIYK